MFVTSVIVEFNFDWLVFVFNVVRHFSLVCNLLLFAAFRALLV